MKTLEQVAADYGLTPDGVSFALEQYQKVICEITHSRMSKLSYYADDILRVANDVRCNGCEYTEPRLLTLEEIQHTDAVWLETHGWKIQGGDIHETVLRRGSDFEDYVTEFADNDDSDITCVNSTLGIDWRCWNIKPSVEQRKNTP